MPFYFRKSVSAGPFRFNFSQHGVGASVGVKGFRLGTGPRGHYVHAGRGGFYYRATIGRPSGSHGTLRTVERQPRPQPDASGMIPISSGNVLAMQDSAFSDILEEINAKNHQPRLSLILGAVSALASLAMVVNLGPLALLPAAAAVLAAGALGAWLDSYKRTVVLFYDDEEFIGPIYEKICAAFDGLAKCAGKWHVQSARQVDGLTDWKRQAGAGRIVSKKPAILNYLLPTIVKSNVTPPVIYAGSRKIFFLPDMILIQDSNVYGAISYTNLALRSQSSNFIEDGTVPSDTEVLYRTWQHPNINGGPDRRFRNNRQIPVCRYELMYLTSSSGLNELFEFSRFGVVQSFASAIGGIPQPAKLGVPLLPSPDSPENVDAGVDSHPLLPAWAKATLWLVVVASICLIFVGLARMNSGQRPVAKAEAPPSEQRFVTALALNCRSAPSTSGNVVTVLQRGASVQVIERQGNWSKITSEKGECWSIGTSLAATKPAPGPAPPRKKVKRRSRPVEEDAPKSPLPEIY